MTSTNINVDTLLAAIAPPPKKPTLPAKFAKFLHFAVFISMRMPNDEATAEASTAEASTAEASTSTDKHPLLDAVKLFGTLDEQLELFEQITDESKDVVKEMKRLVKLANKPVKAPKAPKVKAVKAPKVKEPKEAKVKAPKDPEEAKAPKEPEEAKDPEEAKATNELNVKQPKVKQPKEPKVKAVKAPKEATNTEEAKAVKAPKNATKTEEAKEVKAVKAPKDNDALHATILKPNNDTLLNNDTHSQTIIHPTRPSKPSSHKKSKPSTIHDNQNDLISQLVHQANGTREGEDCLDDDIDSLSPSLSFNSETDTQVFFINNQRYLIDQSNRVLHHDSHAVIGTFDGTKVIPL